VASLFAGGLRWSLRWGLHTSIDGDCLYFPANKIFQQAIFSELPERERNFSPTDIANEVSGAARRGVCFSGDGNEVTVENLEFEYSNVFKRVR
jgi:hypothetical protein